MFSSLADPVTLSSVKWNNKEVVLTWIYISEEVFPQHVNQLGIQMVFPVICSSILTGLYTRRLSGQRGGPRAYGCYENSDFNISN